MKSTTKFGAAVLAMTLLTGLGATALLLAGGPALAAEAAAAGTGLGSEVWTWGLAAAAASTALAALGPVSRWPRSARRPSAPWPRNPSCSVAC